MRIFTDFLIDKSHEVTGEAHTHLSVVLRAKIGDNVILCNGDGFIYDCVISSITKNKTVLLVADKRIDYSEPQISCDLFFVPTKNDYKFLIQKTVEIGVNAFYPFTSRHSVVTGINPERLNAISYSAAGQSGRNKPPKVFDLIDFEQMLKKIGGYDAVIFPYERAKKGIKEHLEGLNSAKIKTIAMIIGSEGGFTEEEAQRIAALNIPPLSLGDRILRAETAAISTLSAIMYQFNQMRPLKNPDGEGR